jgi:tRNA pseudouridine55 synthase
LLVCLLGEATKLSQYVMNEHKVYWVQAKLGEITDTGDITGQVMETNSASAVTEAQVNEAAQTLVGNLELPVPKYSAIKIKGKKLYEYAREGQDIELPNKQMIIRKIDYLGFENGIATFVMECEKGTYVRSWVERLGNLLGCGATVSALRRTRTGDFLIDHAVKLSDVKPDADWKSLMLPMGRTLGHWPALKVIGRDSSLVRHGQLPKGVYAQLSQFTFEEGVKLIDDNEGLLALVVADQQRLPKLARVFNTKR